MKETDNLMEDLTRMFSLYTPEEINAAAMRVISNSTEKNINNLKINPKVILPRRKKSVKFKLAVSAGVLVGVFIGVSLMLIPMNRILQNSDNKLANETAVEETFVVRSETEIINSYVQFLKQRGINFDFDEVQAARDFLFTRSDEHGADILGELLIRIEEFNRLNANTDYIPIAPLCESMSFFDYAKWCDEVIKSFYYYEPDKDVEEWMFQMEAINDWMTTCNILRSYVVMSAQSFRGVSYSLN